MYRIAESERIRTGNRDFLYLAAEKAIFEVDEPTTSLLETLGGVDSLTREQIDSRLATAGFLGEEGDACVEDLVRRRILLQTNGNATQRVGRSAHPLEIPLKTLILHLTDACNLECTYCYHSGKSSASSGDRTMDTEVAQRSIDFLMEKSGPLEEVVVVLFGGEPLLNFKTITEIVDYGRRKSAENGKKISFAITTNGTLLDDVIADYLISNGISITVSLDGPAEDQDRYRRFRNGEPTYAVLQPKLQRLLTQPDRPPVVARVTLVESPDRVPQILDHLLRIGFAEVGFAPVTTGHPSFQLGIEAMGRLLDVFQTLSDRFLDAVRAGDFFGFSNLIDLLVSLHQGEVMDYPCGAGLGLFAVDPQGKLFLCQRFTGDETYHMGDLRKGYDWEKLSLFRKEAEVSNKAECRTCWARAVCTGGCYHEACVREGSHLKPNLHYCNWIRRWTRIGLETYCQIATEDPDYLEKLSMTRGYSPSLAQ